MTSPIRAYIHQSPTRDELALAWASSMDEKPRTVTFQLYFFGMGPKEEWLVEVRITKMVPESGCGTLWNIEGVSVNADPRFNGKQIKGCVPTDGRLPSGEPGYLLMSLY